MARVLDAAMLVAPEPGLLVASAAALVAAADAEGSGFPRMHGGIAHGVALARGGDWYGEPVNLASRICGVAPAAFALSSPLHDDICTRGPRPATWQPPQGTR